MGALFFILAGTRPLFVPDEGRYAEIAREMTVSHNYITPYLNHIKYFEKPVLFYWLESAAIQMGGLNLWSLRSVNAILGLLGCLFTYFTARTLYDRTTGLLAALILSTSTLYFVMSHMISLDLPVTVFLSAAFYAFLLGIHSPVGKKRRFWLWGAAAFSACAVLTKGLIGIVFPAMIIGIWIACMNEWRLLRNLYLPSSILIFILLAAPWHILAGKQNPEFFYFYFIKQHFLRYTALHIGHYQPVWFFLPCLVLGFFPWIVFLPQAIKKILSISWKERLHHKIEIFLLIWAAFIFLFFSFSKSKLIPYILPVFPPLAILTAHYLQQSVIHKKFAELRAGYFCLFVMSILIAYVFYVFPERHPLPSRAAAFLYLSFSAGLLFTGTLTASLLVLRKPYYAFLTTIMTAFLFLLCSLAALPAIDTRTILPLAKILKPILKPEDEVITFNQYYQDLPFYLQRRVSILNWKNELTFGMLHQPAHDWMITYPIFWQRWESKRRVYAVMSKEEYDKFILYSQKHTIIGQTLNNILVSNQTNKTIVYKNS